jgi:hypothetical protein
MLAVEEVAAEGERQREEVAHTLRAAAMPADR